MNKNSIPVDPKWIMHQKFWMTIEEACKEHEITLDILEQIVDNDLVAVDFHEGEMWIYRTDMAKTISDLADIVKNTQIEPEDIATVSYNMFNP